mmetsp:Transcript_26054/g.90698  ORF Transcript_26054/g.90698 Transcript_26054/m.90698 type:complete len:204 (-) Transcript_26054:68-679(-)
MGCKESKQQKAGDEGPRMREEEPATGAKVVMVGSTGVGKTSLVVRFTQNEFGGNNQPPTTGLAFVNKRVRIEDGTEQAVQLWDTAGEERFRSQTRGFFRDVEGAMVVYSVDDGDSLEAVSSWVADVRRENPDACLVLVANKSDVVDRDVTEEKGAEVAERLAGEVGRPVPVFHCSAKTGDGVAAAFVELVTRMNAREAAAALA